MNELLVIFSDTRLAFIGGMLFCMFLDILFCVAQNYLEFAFTLRSIRRGTYAPSESLSDFRVREAMRQLLRKYDKDDFIESEDSK